MEWFYKFTWTNLFFVGEKIIWIWHIFKDFLICKSCKIQQIADLSNISAWIVFMI